MSSLRAFMSSPRCSLYPSAALALSVLLAAATPSHLHAAVTPEILKDLRTTEQDTSIGTYVPIGNHVLFRGTDLAHGNELWKSDGTPEGTSMVADVYPGSTSGTSYETAGAGNLCFFAGNNGVMPGPLTELWKSDGTAAGTMMVKDINPNSSSMPAGFTPWGNRIVFSANDGNGKELWVSDGTQAGTVLLANLSSDTKDSDFGSGTILAEGIGSTLYFKARAFGSTDKLWKTDGTVAGTSVVGDGVIDSPSILKVFSGNLYVVARDTVNGTPGLWRVNSGTTTAVKVADMGSEEYSYNASLAVMGGWLYYTRPLSYDSTTLWRTSGTAAGTSQVKALGRANGLTCLSGLSGRTGEALYFSNSTSTTGVELWVSNGTSAGTVQLLEINPGTGDSYPGQFVQVGNKAYFRADRGDNWRHLWITDGSASGTRLLKEFTAGIGAMVPAGARLVFTATDAISGREMWSSDGTAANTRLVRNFRGTWSSEPEAYMPVGSRLFFRARPGGWERLMVTDGTAAGTQLVGQSAQYSADISGSAPFGGGMIYGSRDDPGDYELYKTDGTEAGTEKIKDIRPGTYSSSPQSFLNMDSYVLFSADDGVKGRELWRSDGTTAGTYMVKDLFGGSTGSTISQLTRVGSQAFFLSSGSLWKTDGTDNGTVQLNLNYPSPGKISTNGSVVIFTDSAYTGLWRSDGTQGNSYRIALFPNSLFSSNLGSYERWMNSGGLLYFLGKGATGSELWRSDGTEAGTFRILQSPATLDANAQGLYAFGSDVVFWLTTPTGHQLWRSDGTAAGTRLIRELPVLNNGVKFSINEQIVADGKIWFLCGDEKSGYALWKSNGTTEGTSPVQIENLPAPWKYDTTLSTAGGYLLFPMETDAYGEEFFRLSLADAKDGGQWTAWITSAGLAGPGAGMDSAPHGDGVPNLLKYAFFLNGNGPDVTPLIPGTGTKGLPRFSLTGGGKEKLLRVEYLRRKESGLSYVPKVSASLAQGSFMPMGGTETVMPVDSTRERVIREMTVHSDITPRLYGTVEVTGP